MIRPALLSRAAALASIVALYSGAAAARARDCPGAAIDADESFRGRYPELLDRLRGELAGRSDIDGCAKVELRVQQTPAIGVSVTLLDGRTASRRVQSPDELLVLLQALLLIPEPREPEAQLEPEPEPPARPVAPARPRPASRAAAFDDRYDRPSPPGAAARQFGVELTALAGTRLGGGQLGYGVGALSSLEVKSWVVGVLGRVDSFRSLQGGDPETALELALLAGHRFDLGAVAIDLTAGPGVATLGFHISHTEAVQVEAMGPVTRPPPPRVVERPGAVPRLLLGARLGFSPHSVLRSFIGLDLDVGRSLGSGTSPVAAHSARLPSFSVGLSVGATVGTR